MTLPIAGAASYRPLPNLFAKLKNVDLFSSYENLEAYEGLDSFYRYSLSHEIGPEYYQLFGIVSSGNNYPLCKKAQILAINGYCGKVDPKTLEKMDLSIDNAALDRRPRNLFLLRSIRWYLATAYPLLEWASEEALNPLRKIESAGHECVEQAFSEGGYWEIIQFYLAIMPFSKDDNLREKIDCLKEFLPHESKDIVKEQLFSLDALKMVHEKEIINPRLNPLEAQKEREEKINDRIIRIKHVLDTIKGHEAACRLFKEDLKIKVMTTVLCLYSHAHVLGLRENVDLSSYANRLVGESLTAVRPSGIHVHAINVALKAYVVLGKYDKVSEIKAHLKSFMERIKP